MCHEECAAKENNIIFFDFGNMAYIDKTNIHKMVPDYVKTPVVAVLCVLLLVVGREASEEITLGANWEESI
jgi:hypothetical protein